MLGRMTPECRFFQRFLAADRPMRRRCNSIHLLNVDVQERNVDAQELNVDVQDLNDDAQERNVDARRLNNDAQIMNVDAWSVHDDAQTAHDDAHPRCVHALPRIAMLPLPNGDLNSAMPDAPDQGQHVRPRALTKPLAALALIGPGILVAATGVGAGDLATAAFAGSQLGLAILWAVVVGALVKFVLNEQLARWQLATGTTILEGMVQKLGPLVWALFGAYLFFWSPFVAVALMKACGAVLHAMAPVVPMNAGAIACSLVGLVMVWLGGFALFQRVMAVCIAVMVLVVLASAGAAFPPPIEFLSGFVPRVPQDREALGWTIALVGGVGGTLTIICYSYWMREAGREKPEDLKACRIDLAVGYSMTALFGLGMIVLAAGVAEGGALTGGGASVIVQVAERVGAATHPALSKVWRWAFLIGAFGAVFSSVLGVWQAVPYVFADWWAMRPGRADRVAPITRVCTTVPLYRGYLVALATLPCLLLFVDFRTAQKLYALIGAAFIPLLALALLVLMNRRAWVGKALANRWGANIALGLAIAVCVLAAAWSMLGL